MLCSLRAHIYASRKSRLATDTLELVSNWRVDLALRFSALWRSSFNDDRWQATGHLELGIVRGPRRAKLVPAKYKHAVMLETRNAAGMGSGHRGSSWWVCRWPSGVGPRCV